jgi:hypothetical protein
MVFMDPAFVLRPRYPPLLEYAGGCDATGAIWCHRII